MESIRDVLQSSEVYLKDHYWDFTYGRNTDHSFINNAQLEQFYSIKDLRITHDLQLNFNKLIDDKINKAYSFLGITKIHFTYLCKDAFITLYKSLVRSHLEYAVQV